MPVRRNKLGFNQKLFKNLESVKTVNQMAPVLPLSSERNGKRHEFEDERDSDDEWLNQDFFESSYIWQHQNRKGAGSVSLQEANALKD